MFRTRRSKRRGLLLQSDLIRPVWRITILCSDADETPTKTVGEFLIPIPG